jgi:diguanylate cyclase
MAHSSEAMGDVAEFAKRTLLKMSEVSVPLTPDNYRLWYAYVSGSNEQLVGEINEIIKNGKHFTDEVSTSLYEKHFGEDAESNSIERIQNEAKRMIKDLFVEIIKTSDCASQYGDKLQTYESELEVATDLTQVQHVIGGLIKETGGMNESTRRMRTKLEEATQQAESLKRQLEETKKEAMIDGLTGIHNRKAFDKRIDQLCQQAGDNGSGFSVIMLDVDFFKKFNDTFGHKIGDGVLQKVSHILKEVLKGKDFPARYGGEEFVVLLPDTNLANACIVAEHIRKEISEHRLKLKKTGESLGTVTVSLGVSEFVNGDCSESVVERADKALYLAKESGRNTFRSERDLEEISKKNVSMSG